MNQLTILFELWKSSHKAVDGKLYIVLVSYALMAYIESIGFIIAMPLLKALLTNQSINQAFKEYPIPEQVTSVLSEIGMINLTLIIIAIFTIKSVFMYSTLVYSVNVRFKFYNYLRKSIVSKIKASNLMILAQNTSSEIVNLANEQSNRSNVAFQNFILFTGNLINSIGYTIVAIYLSFVTTAVVIGFGIAFVALSFSIGRFISLKSATLTKKYQGLANRFNQYLTSLKYNKATYMQSEYVTVLNNEIDKISKLNVDLGYLTNISRSLKEPFTLVTFIAAVYIIQAYHYTETTIVMATIFLLYRAITILVNCFSYWNLMIENHGGLIEINKFLDAKIDPEEDYGDKDFTLSNGITLNNVSFFYHKDEEIISNFSWFIPAMQTTAIVGASGSGKTTLVDLISRCITPCSGEILFDGVSAKNIKRESFRKHIGYLTIDSIIFEASIFDNIVGSLTRDKSENKNLERVTEVVRHAGLVDFMEKQPAGLYTKLSENGRNLSTGERQRLLLARELYKQPKLLILDEPTSALDNDSEDKIISTLKELDGKLTIILIAHKLSTIKHVKPPNTIDLAS